MDDVVQQVEALKVNKDTYLYRLKTTHVLCLMTAFFVLVQSSHRTIYSRNTFSLGLDRSSPHKPHICSPNEVVGMFINYTFYGIDGCVLHFVDAPSHISTLVDRSKNKKLWVHFIGDSDTRGLVLGLLRFLYSPLRAAVTREMFAKAYDCWDEASQQTCPGVTYSTLQECST